MNTSQALLRLLEPAVRPVGPPEAGRGVGKAPFEALDFQALLQEADAGTELAEGFTAMDAEPAEVNAAARSTAAGPLDALAAFGRIENTTLRDMLAGRMNPTATD